jgi:hypothetical protein
MAKTSEVTITLHEDTIQQSQMVPIVVAASSNDTITDLMIWASTHKAGRPDDPWIRITVLTGNNYKDAAMTQPIQIPQSWFPLVIDVYEAASRRDPADVCRTEKIEYDVMNKDRTFRVTKRIAIAAKDKHPSEPYTGD